MKKIQIHASGGGVVRKCFSYAFFLIIFSPFVFIGKAQNISSLDTLNKKNNKGEPVGCWIEYLDGRLNRAKKEKASFCRYVYYENGNALEWLGGKYYKVTLEVIGNKSVKDSVVVMDGIYRLYKKKGKLFTEDIYSKGMILESKVYSPPTGRILDYIDYTKLYNNEPHSFYYETYRGEDGKLRMKAYRRKIKGKWKTWEIE